MHAAGSNTASSPSSIIYLENRCRGSARLSALDGLDAPVKQEHSGTINVESVSMIRARMAKRRAG